MPFIEKPRVIISLTREGVCRVLGGQIGLTFIVNSWGQVEPGRPFVHVRDYRYPMDGKAYAIWTVPFEGYHVIGE